MGVDLLDGYRAVDVSKALRLAQKAIELDPEFAEA
jgi:hypothetical protein